MGAWEGFDNMVNDALYGILYRDINIVRGLIDQRVSRMINGYFGVVINTGEDNYLRTADAIEAAPSVTASQFINHQLARESGVPDAQIGLGDAFEIDVPVTNGLLLRVGAGAAHARAVPRLPRQVHAADPAHGRQPVPHARRRHAVQPRHDRHRAGHPDDRRADGGDLHAPHPRPRARACRTSTTCSTPRATSARRSSSSPAGSSRRARRRCSRAHTSCSSGSPRSGCSRRSRKATFGDVSRSVDEGRGIEGIVETEDGYFNPVVELMRRGAAMHREVDLTAVRPYADHLDDGLVQMSFTLPVPYSLAARKAALELAAKMGFEEPGGRPLRAAHRRLHVLRDVRALHPDGRLQRAAGRGLRHRVHERGRDRALRRRAASGARSSSSARAPARTRTAWASTRCST